MDIVGRNLSSGHWPALQLVRCNFILSQHLNTAIAYLLKGMLSIGSLRKGLWEGQWEAPWYVSLHLD